MAGSDPELNGLGFLQYAGSAVHHVEPDLWGYFLNEKHKKEVNSYTQWTPQSIRVHFSGGSNEDCKIRQVRNDLSLPYTD